MTTLITGGAGFIGSRLAARLLSEGKQIVIMDNFNDYYNPQIKRANIASLEGNPPLIEGDIRDRELVDRVFKEYGVTHVAHLAAMAAVRYSVDKSHLYTDVNVMGTVNLMDAAIKYNIEQFVFASTSSIYGNDSRIPFQEEDAAAKPLAPYPASKRAAELFAHSYHHLYNLPVTILRFFNVYGPNGRPDMMPLRAIEAILQQKPIDMYDGGDLERDWTYIDDTVDGVAAALERPLGYALINLGYGSPTSLLTFIQIYEELIGRNAIKNVVPAPKTEPRITYCDNTQARKLLNFNPKTPIEEGLARTWNWYRQRYNVRVS